MKFERYSLEIEDLKLSNDSEKLIHFVQDVLLKMSSGPKSQIFFLQVFFYFSFNGYIFFKGEEFDISSCKTTINKECTNRIRLSRL
jgi:hypothetical protein